MPKRQDLYEEYAIQLLDKLIQVDRHNRDALPGSAMQHIKKAQVILKKRRKKS